MVIFLNEQPLHALDAIGDNQAISARRGLHVTPDRLNRDLQFEVPEDFLGESGDASGDSLDIGDASSDSLDIDGGGLLDGACQLLILI